MSSGPSPRQPKRWPQEGWTAVRKRHRDPSKGNASSASSVDLRAEVTELTEKLRAEIAARESLQDFCYALMDRVCELERREIRRLRGSKGPPRETEISFSSKGPPPKPVGSTVSMHGSSAVSRSGTTETEADAEPV